LPLWLRLQSSINSVLTHRAWAATFNTGTKAHLVVQMLCSHG